MKIRTKLTLTLFLLTTLLISIFSGIIFFQVRQGALRHAEADLAQHLQHDFEHLEEIERSPVESHQKGTFHRIEVNGHALIDTLPADFVSAPKNYLVTHIERERGGDKFLLTGAADFQQTNSYLQLLGGLLAAGVLLVAGLMVPASWWIAGWCLAPFRRLADQTALMDASVLAFRFPHQETPPRKDDEYGRLVEAFNQLLSRLDRSFGELNLFAAKASHELKTPLASMMAQTEKALRRPDLSGESRETLQRILAQALRLSRVTEQLLVLAHVDSQKSRPPGIPADAARVLKEVVESLAPKAAALEKTIHTEFPLSLTVRTGADILAISVGNLLENALKFGRKDVFLRLTQAGASAEISVEDDGPGLNEAQTIKITTPFEKNTRLSDGSQNPGSGLGLAIVQTAIDSVKGKLSFNKSQHGGVLARITISLAT